MSQPAGALLDRGAERDALARPARGGERRAVASVSAWKVAKVVLARVIAKASDTGVTALDRPPEPTATERSAQREHAALLRVAQLVARGVGEAELFGAVAVEAAGLIGDEATNLVRFVGPRTYTVIATCGGPAPVGLTVDVPEHDPGTAGEVLRTHRPARRDNYVIRDAATFAGRGYGVGSSVSVPIIVEGRLWGMLGSLTEGRGLPPATEDRLQQFAELVAAAIANSDARSEIQMLADEQSALLRVAELVAHGARDEDLFEAVAREAAGLIDQEATTLVRYDGARSFTVLATFNGPVQQGSRFTVPHDDGGTLDEVLSTGRSARLDNYEDRAGQLFSQRHYGVGSSVSVPIKVEGELWGTIGTLTRGHQLPPHTEARLQKFADLVAAAIANSLARAEVTALADEQAALRRVAELVARGASLQDVFTVISLEASRILSAPAALIRAVRADSGVVVAAHHGLVVGHRVSLPASFGPDDDQVGEVDRGVTVPISVEGRTWGALMTTSGASTATGPSSATTRDKLDKFAGLAAAAIANAENKAQLTASRARVVATADETRRRLQRDVHDGAQQRLVQTVLTLQMARDTAAADEPVADLVGEALRYAERATAELRDVVHGILPASLSRGGLRSGIESLLADLPTPVRLDFSAPRLPAEMELTAFFIVAEALTNVVKHARATKASVRVGLINGHLALAVSDDGRGGADASLGSGLTGLQDRVDAAEGRLRVSSRPGAGTTVHASLPVPGL